MVISIYETDVDKTGIHRVDDTASGGVYLPGTL